MRRTTFFALVVGGLLALGCGAGSSTASGGGSDSGDSGGNEEAAAKTAKVGEAARDGKFEFTVKAPKCGVAEVGDKYLNQQAQGQFCLVTVTVKNIGDKPQTFSDSSQKAFGADDAEYSADSGAGIYANKNADTLFTEINPGNKVTGVVVFDIPKKAKLAKLELHDSPFSGGVTVQLG
ncbi:DUF4352 domain-containing protein [Asanoa sp. NPDC049518]|uniref:DUF4352 domain-containing protein n=1 Tax=unclassified Asanoa TaxID=2685164 RepID=UPI00342278A7